MSRRRYKFLVHWSGFPRYAADCLSRLRTDFPVDACVLLDNNDTNAPFDRGAYPEVGQVIDATGWAACHLRQFMVENRPDAVYVSGWMKKARQIAAIAQKHRIPVVAGCDNYGHGALRRYLFPWYYRTRLAGLYDFYWVPGARAKAYLVNSGIPHKRVMTGLYCVDRERGGRAWEIRTRTGWPRRFLFLGQYIERKGVPELLEAFVSAQTGWELAMCGSGPLKELVWNYARRGSRIVDRGFVQAAQMPEIMANAGALVLPSRVDHWPLVILEAVAAGLPVICSHGCGSVPELVEDGGSGRVVRSRDIAGLATALRDIAGTSVTALERMGRRSLELAAPFTTERWAKQAFGFLLASGAAAEDGCLGKPWVLSLGH